MTAPRLPVAIIGAGPVGLAAAAHLLARGLDPLVLEAGPDDRRGGARLGPCADVLALALRHRRRRPRPAGGRGLDRARTPRPTRPAPSWSERYLAPLAATAALRGRIRTGARVDRHRPPRPWTGCRTARRATPRPSCCMWRPPMAAGGDRGRAPSSTASGTWQAPNPARRARHAGPGRGRARPAASPTASRTCWARRATRYAGATTLVVGAGHSAMNAVLDLAELAADRARHAHPLGLPPAARRR